jgi:hypothetical protein
MREARCGGEALLGSRGREEGMMLHRDREGTVLLPLGWGREWVTGKGGERLCLEIGRECASS